MPKSHIGQPPVDRLWLKQQFDKINQKLDLILKRISELGTIDQLKPELANALIETAKKTKAIDQKVPDKTVPPIP